MKKEIDISSSAHLVHNINKASEEIKKRIEKARKYLDNRETENAFDEIKSILAQSKTEQCHFETIQSLLECMIAIKKNTAKKPWDELFFQWRTEVIIHLNPKQQSQLLMRISESYESNEEAALWYLTEALALKDEVSGTERLTAIENHHYLKHFKPYSLLVKKLGGLKTELPKKLESFMNSKSKSHQERMELFQAIKHLFQHQPPSTSDEWKKSYEQYQLFLKDYAEKLARRIELFFLRQSKNNEDLDLILFPKESLKTLLEELHDSLQFISGWENKIKVEQSIARKILRAQIWDVHQAKLKSEEMFDSLKNCFINRLDDIPFPVASHSELWINARWMHQNAKNNFFTSSADITKAQEEYQRSFFGLLQQAIKHLSESLVPPPCDWGFYLAGSRARGDASPRSDLDVVLLIAHEKYLNDDFFHALLKGIQSLIIALGDCWQWTKERGFQATGIQIDSGDLNQSKLQTIGPIQTPKQLAEKVTAALKNPNEKNMTDFILAFGLLIVKPVFITNETLLSDYQNALKQMFTSINLYETGWFILKGLQKSHYPYLKDYLSSLHLMGLAFICFETNPNFFNFEWQNVYPLYAKYINPTFAKQCMDDLQQLYRIRKTYHETHLTQEIPIQDLPENEQKLLAPITERFHVFFQGLPEKYTSFLQRPYCPYQAYVGKKYEMLSKANTLIQYLKLALAQNEVIELPLKLIEHLKEPLEKEFAEKQFSDLSLFDLCIATGMHPDTPILHKSLIEHAFEQKNISAITALLQKGAGQYTHFPISDWILFLEKTTPQTVHSLLSIWSKHNSSVNWYYSKQILFESPAQRERSKEELARFIEGVEIKQKLLKEEVFKQMFETKNFLFSTYQAEKKDNQYGRRAVAKIQIQEQIFFFKFFPEAAPMEDAVQQFAHAYFPNTIPHSELIRYKNNKEIIPILISEGIQGYNLQDIFNALSDEPKVQAEALKKGIKPELAKSCLDNIDHYSFSQQVLLTLFTNDEDGKPDNKYLVPFQQGNKTLYRIVSIDNDHSFLEPLHINEKGKKTLQLKSILFCFNHMKRPLHPQAVAEFLKLDATQCIEQWLKKLIARQEQYFKLFDGPTNAPDSVREALLKKDVILQLIFPKKSIAKLWEKWTEAQSYLNQYQDATSLELLRRVMPEVGLFYINAFNQCSTPFNRFDYLAEKSYTSVLINKIKSGYITHSSSSRLLQLQGVSPKALTQKENGLGPKESLAELEIAKLEHTKLDAIFKEVMQGQFEAWSQLYLDNNKATVINRLDWKKLSPEKRKELFDLLITSKLNTKEFTLNHCTLLDNQKLELLLQKMPGLQQLTLISSNITDSLWGFLSHYCEAIQSITLVNLPNLLTTEEGFLIKSTSLSLFELTELTLENFLQLNTLKINTPKLKTLSCKNLPELMTVETSAELETFSFQGMPKLNLNGLGNSFETITPFKKGLLPEHWQQSEKLALFITYPFLLSRTSFKWIPQFLESCMELLKSFPKEAMSIENLLTLKQLIKTHCKQITLVEKTLPNLLSALKDSNWGIREAAALALGNLGPKAATEPVIKALLEMLKDSDSDVRQAAAQALGNLGQHATESIVAALLEKLKDSEWQVREAAALALGYLDPKAATKPVIAALLERLKDDYSAIRKAAAQALDNLDPKAATKPVIAALLIALKDISSDVRSAAVQALGNLSPKTATEPVIAALLEMLKDGDWDVRKAVAGALGNLGQYATELIIAALLKRLKDSSWDVREAAALALDNLGPKAATKPVIAALLARLKDSDRDVRRTAVQALGNLSPKTATEPVIAALIEQLEDSEQQVRQAAAQAFGNLGPKAATEPVIKALLKRLKDSNEYVREAAAQALGNLGQYATEPVITALLEMLKDSGAYVRYAAALALGNLGPKAASEPAIAALLKRLKDSDWHVRQAAAQALGNLGPKAATEPVIKALLERLKDSNWGIYQAAAQAFGNLGPKAATEPVIVALLEMLKDSDSWVRRAVAQALGNLGPKAATEPVIKALLNASTDSDRNVRQAVAGALGNLGPRAVTKAVITVLLIELRDDDENIRKAAAQALGHLAQSLNQAYQSLFDTLTQQKNAYLAEIHKIEFTVSDAFTETQLIEQLKKLLKSTTPIMKIKIHGLKTHSKEALLLIQKWIESNPASLIHLDLEQNIFEGKLIHQFISETLSQCEQLQFINLNHTQLDDSVWPALQIILPQLKNLSLKHNQLKDIEPLLAILPQCTKLTQLYLQGNLFTPADVQPLLKEDLNPELKQHLQQQLANNALTQHPFLKPSSQSSMEDSAQFIKGFQ